MTGQPRLTDPAGLWLLCIAAFISMASMRACDPLLPVFAQTFAVSTGEAARTISAFAVAYGLLQLLYGPLGDRYGKFRVIAVAVSGCVIGNILAMLAQSLDAMIVARAVAGALGGGIIPLAMAWIGDSVSYERRQEVLARLLTATLLGTAGGQWMSGLLAETLGWRWVFGLLTALFLAAGLSLLWMARTRGPRPLLASEPDPGFVRNTRTVLSTPWAQRILLLTMIEGAFVFSSLAFIPAFLHDAFGLSLKSAAAIVALFAVGGLLYAGQARRLVGWLGERGLVLGGSALLVVAYLLMAFGSGWPWSIPACLLGGLGFTMLHGTLQTHATQMAPSVRGTAVSLFGASLFLGQSLGVLGAALLVDHSSYRVVFVVAAIAIAALGYVFARALRRRAAA